MVFQFVVTVGVWVQGPTYIYIYMIIFLENCHDSEDHVCLSQLRSATGNQHGMRMLQSRNTQSAPWSRGQKTTGISLAMQTDLPQNKANTNRSCDIHLNDISTLAVIWHRNLVVLATRGLPFVAALPAGLLIQLREEPGNQQTRKWLSLRMRRHGGPRRISPGFRKGGITTS